MSKTIQDAKWICGDENISAPRFRREFILDKQIKKATLSISGLGYFKAYINGERVGDDELVPAQTDYEKRELNDLIYPMKLVNKYRVFYLDYSVTKMLEKGKNVLGIWLGNGFYRQKLRTAEGVLHYDETLKTIACLEIEYADNEREYILTDENGWLYTSSPLTMNNIFYGENYDANLKDPMWCKLENDISKFLPANIARQLETDLLLQECPTDKIQESYSFHKIKTDGNRTIYGLDQNIAGFIFFRVSGKKGEIVKIKFAGELDETNELEYTSSGGEHQIQQITYTLNDEEIQEYHHNFSWAAFRYIEVITDADIKEISAKFVSTNLEHTASFSCSNPLFNKIYDTYIITQRANMHGCITSDCPHRERLSYTGDGQLVSEPILLNFDGYSFMNKWIDDLIYGQNIKTGHVPHTVPFMGGGGGPAWGSAIVIVPYNYYIQTGDISILKKTYNSMIRWMNYLETKTDKDFIIHREEKDGWCLGEWCTAEQNELPEIFVNSCTYAYITNLLVEISLVLGKETKKYKKLFENICVAVNKAYFNKNDNSYSIGKQGSEAIALWTGVVPNHKRINVAKRMADHIINNCDGHLDTGMFGTPALLAMLTKYGYTNLAYEIMNKKTYPSFGYMFENNATTLWEEWDGAQSHNHPMFGKCTSWFIKDLAGINIYVKDGKQGVKIQPNIPKKLSYVNASIITKTRTEISVSWRKNADRVIVTFNIPKNYEYVFVTPEEYIIEHQSETKVILKHK